MTLQVIVKPTKHTVPHNRDRVDRYYDRRRGCWVTVTQFSTPR